MQKKVTIITIIVVLLIFVGTIATLYLVASSAYNKTASALDTTIKAKTDEIAVLKASKDSKGYTATEVVKGFFMEVKSDSLEKARLYLAPDAQSMDIGATLKLGSDFANISLGENFEEVSGDNMLVKMTFVMSTEDTAVRVFQLSKYDDAWKITGVTAE